MCVIYYGVFMKNNDLFYLQLAYKRSQIAFLNNNVPVGCVITDKNGMLISSSNINSKSSDNINHAEMLSLFKYNNIKNKVHNAGIYISLIPCPMCSGAIYINNIKKCVYGADSNDNFYNEVFHMNMRRRYVKSYLKERCSKIVKLFFLVRR